MPHITVEYSANILDDVDIKNLLSQVNKFLAGTGLFNLNDIKSRAIEHDMYVIGDGDSARAFVTVNVCILSGRDERVKKQLSDGVLKLLETSFPKTLAEQKASLTVQISEIDKDSYGKLTSYDD